MPRWTPLNSRSLAEDGRETLETALSGAMHRAMRSFLADVAADAHEAMDGPVLLAAGVPEPFTLGAVQRRWKKASRTVLRTLAESADVSATYLDGAAVRLAESAIPDLVFSSARAVLAAAIEAGWSRGILGTALSTALSLVTGSTVQTAPGVVEQEGVNWRAVSEMWARTEATAAWNSSALDRMGREGMMKKQWSAVGDNLTRPEHLDADGQVVPVAEPFSVGGESLMFPGDPAGSTGMIANCRCVCVEGLNLE